MDPFLDSSPPKQLLRSLLLSPPFSVLCSPPKQLPPKQPLRSPLPRSPPLRSPFLPFPLICSSLPLLLELTFLPFLIGGKMMTVDGRLCCLDSAGDPVCSKLVMWSSSSSSSLSIITELAWMVVMNSLREAWMFWTDVSWYQGMKLRSRLTQ